MPSCEKTPKGKWFFQQQTNVNHLQIQSNTTLDYGLGHNFELGLNVFGLNYIKNENRLELNKLPGQGPLEPQLLLNGQHFFQVSEETRLGIGLQTGSEMMDLGNINAWSSMAYLNSRHCFWNEKVKLVLGLFGANAAYSGVKSHAGIMGGFEFRFQKKLAFIGDLMAGSPFLNSRTLGLIWYFYPEFPITFGWQLPWKQSRSLQAFILELSYAPTPYHR